MKRDIRKAAAIAASSLALSLAGTAVAAPIECHSTEDDRYMLFSPSEGSASCAGSAATDGANMPNNLAFHEDLGLEKIEWLEADEGSLAGDWFQTDGFGGTSGTILFAETLYDEFDNVHVAFKFGNPHVTSDWMSYSISGVFEAGWTAEHEEQGTLGLSNVYLWGNSAAQVPAPGALGLLGIGLIGLFAAARRHNHAA